MGAPREETFIHLDSSGWAVRRLFGGGAKVGLGDELTLQGETDIGPGSKDKEHTANRRAAFEYHRG